MGIQMAMQEDSIKTFYCLASFAGAQLRRTHVVGNLNGFKIKNEPGK
jgi:hypothetical protein